MQPLGAGGAKGSIMVGEELLIQSNWKGGREDVR